MVISHFAILVWHFYGLFGAQPSPVNIGDEIHALGLPTIYKMRDP
jgi:hypothetical protein